MKVSLTVYPPPSPPPLPTYDNNDFFPPELIPYGWGQDGDDGDDGGDGGGGGAGGSSERLRPSFRETAEMASSRGGSFLTSADRYVCVLYTSQCVT